MSTRYEWMHLPAVEYVPNGWDVVADAPAESDAADDQVVTEGGALLLTGDSVTVVTGAPADLRKWLLDALLALDLAVAPDTPPGSGC